MKHPSRSYNNIFITGMPGSGKSTFGKQYAHFTKREFIDFDDFFEKTFKTKISKVFISQGVDEFRNKETQLLKLLLSHKNKVIALGGGTLLRKENYLQIESNGIIAALIGLPHEILAKRIWRDIKNLKKRKRPLFNNCQSFEQVLEIVETLWQERHQSYLSCNCLLNQRYNSNDNLIYILQKFEKSKTCMNKSN